MVSESTSSRRPVLTLDELAQPLTRRPERLYTLTASDLALAFSQAIDLAEGKPLRHAQRVCYIATALADALGLDAARRTGVYFGALLHDAGVPLAASSAYRAAGLNETVLFEHSPLRSPEELRADMAVADVALVLEAIHDHAVHGAEIARALELPDEVATAIASHHDRWDGNGVLQETSGAEVPIEGRILAVADLAESLIANEFSSLAARRHFGSAVGRFVGVQLDAEVVARLMGLMKSDEFWLGLYSDDLSETLNAIRPAIETRKSRKRVMRFAEVFASIVASRGGHKADHFKRAADNVERLAEAVGLDPAHVEMLRIAALLLDVGQLGVPARVMAKPDILSVAEMQVMRQHPASSELVLQDLPGFEEIAVWIGRHHERPDGKGYPEMLEGDDIPVESRILAVADVYAALTADRPHRKALPQKDARQVLLNAAGAQLDPELVNTFCSLLG